MAHRGRRYPYHAIGTCRKEQVQKLTPYVLCELQEGTAVTEYQQTLLLSNHPQENLHLKCADSHKYEQEETDAKDYDTWWKYARSL